MAKEFPGTDLKAMPHINSKIHTWKKNFSMLAKSGIGWNTTTKMVEAADEAWESYLKVDANAKLIRYKSWPFYEQWCEIFGRDRAQGLQAKGFTDDVNIVLSTPDTNGSNVYESLDQLSADCDATSDNMSVSQPAASGSNMKATSKKRKKSVTQDPTVAEILDKFCEKIDARLGEIAKRMGHDYDMASARKDLWSVVEMFDELSLEEKLLATRLVVSSPDDMVLWFTLSLHAREELIRLKMSGRM